MSRYFSEVIFYGANRCPVADLEFPGVTHVTHLFCAFAPGGAVDMDALVPMTPDAPALIAAAHAHGVKVLLGLGILDFANVLSGTNFLAAATANPDQQAQRIVAAVDQHGYDGVAVDWEMHNLAQAWPVLTAVLRALRLRLGRRPLTAYAFAQPESAGLWGGSEALSYLDVLELMTYDLAGRNTGLTSYNSPLYGGWTDQSVDSVVAMYLAGGTPASKMAIGIPFYALHLKGRTGPNQAPPADHAVGAPPDAQIWGYNRVLAEWLDHLPRRWHVHAQVPSVAGANEWVSYDDADSVWDKVRYARARGLAGWFALEFGSDYLPGQSPKHPLVQAIADALDGPRLDGEPVARVRIDAGAQIFKVGSPQIVSGCAAGLATLGVFVFTNNNPTRGNGSIAVVGGRFEFDISAAPLPAGSYEIVIYGPDSDTLTRVPMTVLP